MKKKKVNNGNIQVSKQKERHIVSWSEEEDNILREQIRVHGAENWAIITSKFKNKTTRQCRRRWYTYLNSDFKKGGWSPEEDMLLCQAQKIFGNRWTEIAKVVPGRTDNAVKNRFTTLCKKRTKHEAVAKENNTASYINLHNKRIIFPNGLSTDAGSESDLPLKKMRTYESNTTESQEEEFGAENIHSREFSFPDQRRYVKKIKEASNGSENNKIQGTFLKKDDPKVVVLMQQAELLSSLAIKVNLDKTDQSLESAWTALQDFLKRNKESDGLAFKTADTDVQLEKLKGLVEDLRSSSEGSRPSCRDHELYASSPASSEYSICSTLLPNFPNNETEAEICLLNEESGNESQSNEVSILTRNDTKDNEEAECEHNNAEFDSPFNVTPLFRAMAEAIPSPKFSESEKHFLMKTLGMDSTSPNPIACTSHRRACKRSLLHSL